MAEEPKVSGAEQHVHHHHHHHVAGEAAHTHHHGMPEGEATKPKKKASEKMYGKPGDGSGEGA